MKIFPVTCSILCVLLSWGGAGTTAGGALPAAASPAQGALDAEPPAPLPPVPSKAQLAWQRLETILFVHFGMNTFTGREWGEGADDPDLFQPAKLDCRQWARVARKAGFGLVILTVKHHDGFCLWPSAFTDYSVKASSWQDGKGDVAGEFAAACRAEGLEVGLYLSPWDRHDPRYGTPAYNDYFIRQLGELMDRYGPVAEVWFDGARRGKGTPYDWAGFYAAVYGKNPGAVIAICGPDVRWVGNESGVARPGESSVQKAVPGRHDVAGRRPGKDGLVWYPAECDVSIRPGWFYHADQDGKVKDVDTLLDIYFESVGRNSVLLLNVPPGPDGLFAPPDVKRLAAFRAALDAIFSRDFARGRPARASNVRGGGGAAAFFGPGRALDGDDDTYWACDDGVTGAFLEVDLEGPAAVNVVDVREAIALGERVTAYHVDARVGGAWKTVGKGTVIGHRNLLRFPHVRADKLRLVIDGAKACPAICGFGAYFDPRAGRREGVGLPEPPEGKAWRLVWADEFEGKSLDESKWSFRPEGRRRDGWWTKRAVSLDGRGNLVMGTLREGKRIADGCVVTEGKFEHCFGFFQARIRFQRQPGHWSAFWLQAPGVTKVGGGGRDGTEIDIVEKPWLDGRVQHTLHWDGYGKDHKSKGRVARVPGVMEGFHTFGLWWSPEEYRFYVDGKETWRTAAGGVSRVPQYIMLSDEVGKWGGDIGKAALPDEFLVDYVRVYDLVDGGKK